MSCLVCIITSRQATQWWKPPRVIPSLGVMNQVSAPNIRVACTTALKKVPDVRGYATYCSMILKIHAHRLLNFFRFASTTGQSSSNYLSTIPRYLKTSTTSKVSL